MKLIKPLAVLMLALLLGTMAAVATETATDKSQPKAVTPQTPAKPADSITSGEIKWIPFDEGLAKAKAEGKNIFVDLTASWCGWCKKMEKETFTQPEVVKMVNENFVPVKVWGDSDKELVIEGYKITERNLATSAFGVTGFPTFFFLCPNGKAYNRLIGYRVKDALMKELTVAQTINCDTMDVKKPDGGEKK
jgi:thiol:disulfide interchange protein